MRTLRLSTTVTIVLGPFVSATDAVTPQTGLTISQADVRLSKNGSAFAQKSDAASCTHMENGYYSCPLNATDTNAAGILETAVTEAGALLVNKSYQVVGINPYDSVILGTDRLGVDLLRVNGSTTPADRIGRLFGANGHVFFTVAAGTLTDRRFTTDLAGYTAGQLKKRRLVMLTGARAGETSLVSDYVVSGGDLSIAVALSGAVSAGDTGLLLP